MNNKVSENPFKNRMLTCGDNHDEGIGNHFRAHTTSFIVVSALFVTLYVVSNVMAVKVIGLWNLFYFDAGTITFPFAYMLGDVLTEIWGYKTARKVILTTLLCNIVMVVCYHPCQGYGWPCGRDGRVRSYPAFRRYLRT